MKTVMMILMAALAVSCSKGGGGGGDNGAADAQAAAAAAANSFCGASANQYQNGYPGNGYNGNNRGYGYSTNNNGFGGAGFSAGFTIGGYAGTGYIPNSGYNVGGFNQFSGYNGGYNRCADQVQMDFCNVVLVNCGITQNGSQLYSSICRNQFQSFQNTHPNLSCSYNRYGVTGTLDNYYLQNQINQLTQMGY